MTSWVCEQSQGGQSSEALLFRWFLGSRWCSFQSPSWQAREPEWPLGQLLFLVPMFSQFLFRDPCSSKVLLLFLKKCFFYLGQAYRWAGRSSSPCLSLLCLVCLPWFLFVSLDWHVPEYSHCAFFVMVIARLHCDILAVIKCDFSSFLFSRGSVFKIEWRIQPETLWASLVTHLIFVLSFSQRKSQDFQNRNQVCGLFVLFSSLN